MKRILIVEDEKDMAYILVEILKGEGFEIDVAYDGEEALSRIKKKKPDLVILDIMLPKLDGRDLLKIVKESEDIRDIPIIMLSAKSEQWDRDTCLRLGAEEYIEKPLEVTKLLRQVRRTISKKI